MVNTGELRERIQSEIQNHLEMVSMLQEKLALVDQVEIISREYIPPRGNPPGGPGITDKTMNEEAAAPRPRPEEPGAMVTLVAQDSAKQLATAESPAVDAAPAGNNPYVYLQKGLQAYLAGKPDKA